MDPLIELDSKGTGNITFYSFGTSYIARVHEWKVLCTEILGTFNPEDYAQKLVNQHYANSYTSILRAETERRARELNAGVRKIYVEKPITDFEYKSIAAGAKTDRELIERYAYAAAYKEMILLETQALELMVNEGCKIEDITVVSFPDGTKRVMKKSELSDV